MDLTSTFQQLGIALGLGLLVGLQRERTESRLAGIRTYPLITVLGTICALLSQQFGGWIVAAGLIALAGMILAGKMVELKEGPHDPGLTSEVAMLARLSAEEGWRVVLVASMANLVFKSLTIGALGHRDLLWKIAPLFGLGLASCALVLTLWGR